MSIRQTMIDDLDGTDGDVQTYYFAYEEEAWEIDLSAKNADSLERLLKKFIDRARPVTGRRPSGNGGIDTQAVRRWAADKDIELSPKGRIPAEVVARYRAENPA